jgi:hypothetical protein
MVDPMSYFGINGQVSTNNSSTSPLGISGVFTGSSDDISQYSTVTVFYDTDQDGTLSMQFSADGTNWDRSKTVPCDQALASGSVHTLEVVARYFRVVYTNGAVGQGHFRLQTIYHNTRSGFLTSSPDQIISKITDAQVMRVSNDPFIDMSRSLYADKQVVHNFGVNPNVGTTERDIWAYGSATAGNINYPWPTSADTLDIVSDNVADDSGGSGALSVQVSGLDANWDQAEETVTLNGLTPVTTATSFMRVQRIVVKDVGTYTGSNVGNIQVTHTGSGDVLAYIGVGDGTTELSMFTVPAGYTAYLRHLHVQVTVATNKELDVTLWRREAADDQTGPVFSGGGKRIVQKWLGVSGVAELDLYAMPSFPEKTDIWGSAVATGTGSKIDMMYDLILVKGDNPVNPQ